MFLLMKQGVSAGAAYSMGADKEGIPFTLITDNMAGYVMSKEW